MNEEPALRQAITAAPEADWPRLVYADWLDDAGEPSRAEFIRAQVRLATLPAWEPFAVRAKHRQPELLSGAPWRSSLPSFGKAELMAWHETAPFHRGFGYSLRVRQLTAFLEIAEELFALEPIGELVLPAATWDEWEALASCPWFTRVKRLRFTTASGLSEPVRALIASPFTTGLEGIAFEVSTSPGMGAVVELLVQSHLAGQLKELEFRIGHDRDGEILEELNRSQSLCLERLTLATLGQTPEAFAQLLALPNATRLKSLNIQHQPIGSVVASALRWGFQSTGLQQFMVLAGQLTGGVIRDFAERSIAGLQSLNFSENIFGEEGVAEICSQPRFHSLRSLQLSRCGLTDASLGPIVSAGFWPNLVECDLRGNRFSDEGVKALVSVPVPRDLTALVLSARTLTDTGQQLLMEHYGDAVIFEVDAV